MSVQIIKYQSDLKNPEAAVIIIIWSLCNLTGILAALLLLWLRSFKAIYDNLNYQSFGFETSWDITIDAVRDS